MEQTILPSHLPTINTTTTMPLTWLPTTISDVPSILISFCIICSIWDLDIAANGFQTLVKTPLENYDQESKKFMDEATTLVRGRQLFLVVNALWLGHCQGSVFSFGLFAISFVMAWMADANLGCWSALVEMLRMMKEVVARE